MPVIYNRNVIHICVAVCLSVLLTVGCGGHSATQMRTGAGKRQCSPAALDGALSEIASLELPGDLPKGLTDQLKGALKAELLRCGVKGTCMPPSGPDNAVTDLAYSDAGGGQFAFSWYCYNKGDYDQNGIVGVSDLTPIAVHFGETVTAEHTVTDVIDGSEDGSIGISDVTPIAMHYGSELDYYSFQSYDPEDDEYTEIARVEPAAEPGDGRLHCVHIFAPTEGEWYRVVPCDSEGNEGTPSDPVPFVSEGESPEISSVSPTSGTAGESVEFTATITGTPPLTYNWDFGGGAVPNGSSASAPSVTLGAPGSYSASLTVTNAFGEDTFSFTLTVVEPGNELPTAEIGATPDTGVAPLEVTLDASGSNDPDGDIVLYEWDWEGDGTYDHNSGSDASAIHTYDHPGIYYPTVRVTDDGGATDTDNVMVSVLPPSNVPPTADIAAEPTSGDVPLTVSFSAEGSEDTDGEIVSYEWDWEGDGTYDHNSGTDATVEHEYDADGTFNATVRVTDDASATDTDSVVIEVCVPNVPPTADISADPTSGESPLVVDFDATGSDDTDGDIVKYEWDWEGDGTYDHDSGANPLAQHTYNDTGDYYPTVRVTDDRGGTDTATEDISVGIWHYVDVVTDSDPKHYSMILVQGNPAIAYYSDTLWYVRANDSRGTAWGTPVEADNTGAAVGVYSSMAIINGNPAISYVDGSAGAYELKFVRATNATGSAWGTPVTVEDSVDVYYATSLVEVNGRPAICYYDTTNDDLVYIRATDANGATWGSPITVASAGDVGSSCSMTIVGDFPAIAYIDKTNLLTMYVRATNMDGTAWGTPKTVDSTGCYFCNLRVVNGYPAIAWHNANTGTGLRYARATDAVGDNWGSAITIDGTTGAGSHASLAIIQGVPAVSYWLNTDRDLRFVMAEDANGASWEAPQALDTDGDVGKYSQLISISGNPAICYRDDSNNDLLYVAFY